MTKNHRSPPKRAKRGPNREHKLSKRGKIREIARWGSVFRKVAKWSILLITIGLSILAQQDGTPWERLLRALRQVLGQG